MRRSIVWVVWLSLAFASSSEAQSGARRVLILNSFESGFAPDSVVTRILRIELSRQSPEPVEFIEVSLQPTPTIESPQERPVLDYLRSTLAGQRLDLVVTMSGQAALFAQKYREQLFPTTPLLMGSVDPRWLRNRTLTAYDTAVTHGIEPSKIIEDVLVLFPETTTVFVVIGASPLEVFWRNELSLAFQPFKDRLNFVYFNELSFTEMLKRAAAAPAHSAIFYAILSVDAKGFYQTEGRTLAELHAVANAPIFGLFSSQLGSGIIGGSLLSTENLGLNTAHVALRILRGESPHNIKTTPEGHGQPTYDWRELQRWGLNEARLPAGNVVRFRQVSVWEEYRSYIFEAAMLLGLQTALIAGLLVQRVRRRRVENALRVSEERFRVMALTNQDLAGRLITSQEAERSRIGRDLHDDVCQRLAVLAMMLSSLKRRLGGSTPQPDVEDALVILQERTSTLATDVRNLSHDLHPSILEHASLASVLKAHCDEFARHHKLDVTFSADDDMGSVDGAAALCIYRVTQEALVNTRKHARASSVCVRLTRTAEAIELEVADDGIGFESGRHMASGLGLRSIDERVRLAGGMARVQSHPGEGTRVVVRLPVSRAATDDPAPALDRA